MGTRTTGPFGALRDGAPVDRGDTAVAVLNSVLHFTIWVLLILAAVWAVREIVRALSSSHLRPGPRQPRAALVELEIMYARGEVTRDEFLSRRADLGGPPPAPPTGPSPPGI